ncbi:UNVERIFIED_CONTAM: hypothetical protein FKN15_032996 [Acipenser sinensis]
MRPCLYKERPQGPLRSPDCDSPCTPHGRAFTRGDPLGPLRSHDCATPPAHHTVVPLPGETLWDPCAPMTVRLPLHTTRLCLYQGRPQGPLCSPDCLTPPAYHAAVPLPGETLGGPCAPLTVRLPLYTTRPCLY